MASVRAKINSHQNGHQTILAPRKSRGQILITTLESCGAGRGGRTPTTLRSADFESAASASSAIPAMGRDVVSIASALCPANRAKRNRTPGQDWIGERVCGAG